jgi:prevent-host-death family protein
LGEKLAAAPLHACHQHYAVSKHHILAAFAALLYIAARMECPMTEYSTSDLSRKSGDIIAEALRRPVTITQRNKPRLVLLSIEDYRELVTRADTRNTGRLETMPDDLFEGMKEAVNAYEQEGEET